MAEPAAPAFRFEGEAVRRLEAMYLTPDIAAHRDGVLERLGVAPGAHVADVGCGPGLLAAAIADRAGPSGHVYGIDVSVPMIERARERCAALPWARFEVGSAEALAFGDSEFDRLACTQVLEFVPDPDRALAEFRRVLRPGGRAVIMDTDWESCVWASRDEARMRRMIDVWDTHCPHPKLPRTLVGRLARAGFRTDAVEVFPLVTHTHAAGTYCGGMVGELARYAARTSRMESAEIAAWQADLEDMDRSGQAFFSLNRYVFAATRL